MGEDQRWIDESDAFVLILGGRYGSVEPKSGKSYVQMEYEYALEKKKPFFALVVSDKHHEERLKEFGSKVDERQHQEKYKAFKATVTQWHCKFWDDQKDIQSTIFQKLPEWAQRDDLMGWVRGDEATNPEVMNELARLSHENSELRSAANATGETFAGVSFQELVLLLSDAKISLVQSQEIAMDFGLDLDKPLTNLLDVFIATFDRLKEGAKARGTRAIFEKLAEFDLVTTERLSSDVGLRGSGFRFRNRLVATGRISISNVRQQQPVTKPTNS